MFWLHPMIHLSSISTRKDWPGIGEVFLFSTELGDPRISWLASLLLNAVSLLQAHLMYSEYL